jgi:inosine-uridine nucleoside N-ribohydrolase
VIATEKPLEDRLMNLVATRFTAFIVLLSPGVIAVPLGAQGEPERHKVIIDADMGEMNDDALVLFMLANSDNVDILGLTIVAGNTWVEEGTAYGLRQLEVIDRTDIPVLMGAKEPLMGSRQSQLAAEETLYGNVEYMGAYSRSKPNSHLEISREPYGGYARVEPSSENAVDFIVRQVKENPHEVTLFVIGPATNVALAVKKNPEIVPLIKSVYYMGGAIDIPGNTSPAAEFNWWFDPESAKICLRTPFREQIVVPTDVAERVYFTKEQYDRVMNAPTTPLTRMYEVLIGPRWTSNPDGRSYVWDVITAAIFLRPEIVTRMEQRFIDIDTNMGPNYGRSIGYHESRRRSFAQPENFPAGTQRVSIVFDIDREAFWNLFVDLMTRQ